MNRSDRLKLAAGALVAAVAILGLYQVSELERAQAQISVPGLPIAPLGYCQLTTLSAATALSACPGGIPSGASAVILKAETQALRYRDDGQNPSATVGMPIATADAPLFYQGTLTALRFIEQTASGKLDVAFYRAPR